MTPTKRPRTSSSSKSGPTPKKKAYAEKIAWEFYHHPDVAGRCYVTVGGLDSITLFLFLRSIGINVPAVDLDTMVIWTLYQCYGWREKRLHDFYLAMAKEHRRMREFYEMDDLYPERYKLKEKGIDIEKWQEEVLNNDP